MITDKYKREGQKHTLYVVGAGSGDPELLTKAAQKVISASRFVAGGRRLLPLAPSGAETHIIGTDLEKTRRFIADRLRQGDVCVLTSGDPGCFSILPFLAEHFHGQICVLPGISSVQLMAARLGMPWQEWQLISLHGRNAALPGIVEGPAIFFCDKKNPPQAVAQFLLQKMDDCFAAVGANLGSDQERFWQGRLKDIAAGNYPSNSLFLVLPIKAKAAKAKKEDKTGRLIATAPGIPDELWIRERGVPLAKSEFRAVLLAKVQPARRRVIWDVGAGTGSYSVECSLLAPQARVIAIDKNPLACSLVAENAARFGATVETVCALAPECFKNLPRPDLVIIGGNDGRLLEIFKKALQFINPGGRLAVTAVLKETKNAAHQAFAQSGLARRQAVRVAIARGEGHKWVENNPVILFIGDKEN